MAYIAKWNKNGNIKLGGAIWSFSTLMGNEPIYIEKLNCSIVGTCGEHCTYCKKKCYVRKSYRHKSVKLGHALNTIAIRENPEQAGIDLNLQIERAKNKPVACRYDQSGEIESAEELGLFIYVAKQNPETQFFCYTKAFDFIIPALLMGIVPENLTILISIWHEYGIIEYNRVKHLKNVKAFVYCDGFDYSAYGLDIQTYCAAYDENGKLDHEITCDRCQKCYNRCRSCKIIGCKDH